MHDKDKIELLLNDGWNLYNALDMQLKRADGSFHIDTITARAIIIKSMRDWEYSVREVLQDCKSVEKVEYGL